MSDTYVPLISSGVAGPLGVVHLPRLWQKVSLEEAGKLASGYPGVGKGFDAMTLAALGLEEQAVRDYIKQNKPTYPQFEAWVKKNAKSLNRESIDKHNSAVRGYNHDDETRKGILSACGIADDAVRSKRRRESEQSRRLVRISSGGAQIVETVEDWGGCEPHRRQPRMSTDFPGLENTIWKPGNQKFAGSVFICGDLWLGFMSSHDHSIPQDG